MSEDKSIFLTILDLQPEELKTILTIAVNLLYADGFAEIEEWNILHLIPALLDVAKDDTPGELKQEWEKKLSVAVTSLEKEGKTAVDEIDIKNKIKTPEKRRSCLLFLFLLTTCDRTIHKKELEFIMEYVARPWKISTEELVSLVKSAGNEIPDARTLIQLLEHYS